VIIVQHLMPASGSAEFLLFDAWDLKSGPIARLPLDHPIHPGFHASFHASFHATDASGLRATR
jgi:carotenoid cleavage dioxygenase-like enzyme